MRLSNQGNGGIFVNYRILEIVIKDMFNMLNSWIILKSKFGSANNQIFVNFDKNLWNLWSPKSIKIVNFIEFMIENELENNEF